MTFGDRRLEREVLELFDRQAQMLILRMQRSAPDAVSALAHTLKGSAQGIGAQRVARAADRVEIAARTEATALQPALGALDAAISEARAVIGELLRSH
jgi:HPt (histidine-containing phosphotransfer) domain-containing protein